MQNSLERLFDGMAAQLRDVVVPGLGDPYARSQALAMVELLGNLATRVEWRCDDLREVLAEVRGALGEAVPDPSGLGNADLVEARAAALAALARALETPAPELEAVASRLLDAELARLRTGMYR